MPQHQTGRAKYMQKPTTRQGQIEHIIQQLSHQQLQTFVREKALQDSDFRDTLLICFADLLSTNEPAEPKYREMLNAIIQRHANADGFIHISSAQKLVESIRNLLDTARKATTPTRETTDFCLAVIASLPLLADKMDDTENHLYVLMRTTCTTLWECYSILSPQRQQELFTRILQEYAQPIYLDLDLDSALLSLLKDWARNDKTRQTACLRQLEQLLKTTHNDAWRKNYLLEQTNGLLGFWKS